jgi:hypothetical protein
MVVALMRYVDRPFAVAVALFLFGSLVGAFFVLMLPSIRGPVIGLLQARLVTPVEAVSRFGIGALLLLVFLNNTIPAALSFAYPYIIAKVNWTPPLTQKKMHLLLSCFTGLCAFLVGFFGLGVALSIGWLLGGKTLLLTLLGGAWVHGPIELAAVLLCVSEPLRVAKERNQVDLTIRLRKDLRLLAICLIILLVSAAIEVFTNA